MGNLKQRLIKAGRDYNYAEGVKVKAAEAVYADQIVYVFGSEGPYLTVKKADADTQLETGGRLLIAKHDIPLNGYGVCLPWKLVKDFNTSDAANVGDPVYLGDSPGTARGDNLVLTAPTSGAGRLVKVGHVKALAVGAQPFCYHVVLAADPVAITAPFPMILVNLVYILGAGTDGSVTLKNGATTMATSGTSTGSAANEVEVMATYVPGAKTVAAGDTLNFDRTNGNTSDIAIAWFIAA